MIKCHGHTHSLGRQLTGQEIGMQMQIVHQHPIGRVRTLRVRTLRTGTDTQLLQVCTIKTD